jgi:hypothetical protein
LEEWVRFRVRIDSVDVGAHRYRVVRPARPLMRAALYADHGLNTEPFSLAMFVDRTSAAVLTAAWAMATVSRHSLVYLPMRHAPRPKGLDQPGRSYMALDLALLHHQVQLPFSRWPHIRRKLGAGTPHSARLRDGVLPRFEEMDYSRRGRKDFRDYLRIILSGHTVFVVGSTIAFQHSGHLLRCLALEAGPTVKNSNDAHHFCVEIDDWQPKSSHYYPENWTNLHVAYSPHWKVH